jgi:hypothetical protein
MLESADETLRTSLPLASNSAMPPGLPGFMPLPYCSVAMTWSLASRAKLCGFSKPGTPSIARTRLGALGSRKSMRNARPAV